jgi:rhodanese-related sulfurtransferase
MRWEQVAPRVYQGNALAVDLRPASSYDLGHVPQAISYPLEMFGADLDSPAWQTFRSQVHIHHFVVLYGAGGPTDAMRSFRTRLVDELGYAMVMFAEDGFAGWEARQTGRKARVMDAETKARGRMVANSAASPTVSVPAVTFAQAAALPDVLWIDSRPRAAFDAGHIPGAISLPENSDKAALDRLRAEQTTDRPIVVYCSGVGCGTSRRLAARLVRDFGFSRVHHFPGGYAEWQQLKAVQAAAEENLP